MFRPHRDRRGTPSSPRRTPRTGPVSGRAMGDPREPLDPSPSALARFHRPDA
ncbi:hypothetical protein SBD_3230 [Streptomyces bottropensis ATCC 25435]|uniref:Uncharacterized protein n=1 Tax=Streptomyces bottropensis ATCC 25435 TaxID=1054862 RepID=M3DGS5_9ACTN|nr:hypothetical protein SBD_3230 [Streptomyces bottropensis ATCC 25435]